MIRVAYIEIGRIGPYALVRHSQSNQLFIGWYNAETRQVVRASLRTDNAVEGAVKVQALVDRGVSGDPRPHLKKAAPQTLRMVLEAHRAVVAKLASAEAETIHIDLIQRSDIADRTVASLVPRHWEELRDAWLAEGKAIGTVSRRISTARAALRRAQDNGDIPSFRKVPEFRNKQHIRSAKPKGAVLSISELARFYDGCTEPHLQAWFALLLGTAARTAAILDLTDGSFDREAGLIRLNPEGRMQTNKWRPCLPAHAHLLPWMDELPPGPTIAYRGQPLKSVKKGRAGAVRRAGLDLRANSYSVRHSLARYMTRQGVDREQIGVWLGHVAPSESPETTLIYSPYAPDFLIDAKRATEDFVAEIAAKAKTSLLEPPLGVRMAWQLQRQRAERGD
ncbi:tyrosine-type recombinase/integrase [Bosea thiooxidans]|uniref:Tyr recombinase domain-containing protein n=1 Tax=Bosea thiooxidans TaxID=53254 RepID=A0A0Q3PL21_9HYPH|nr:site-specific integrase [Bosea thiooxidans]KQK30446.1 hypothetical protein ARD30_13555 [Bosea thiooxidans]